MKILRLAWILVAACSACSKRVGTEAPPTTGRTLCAIAEEADYFDTRGSGTIEVQQDPNLQTLAIAFVYKGRRLVVLNPDRLAPLPSALQDIILAHEIGHHYLGGALVARSEYLADAFATRVVTHKDGTIDRVEAAAKYLEENPRPPEADRPSDVARAAYMRVVARALLADPNACAPDPPELR